ncbi:protease modulator HflC [Pedosphaera parvula]|uniref:Protein HflC n=1 Tax=Pedosphaera parvula (strain Ellin514) TaxID=320771 RepID=B9XHB5_PEDPL|nr:protease modulator HflC [Pedosphaera parvula]EEF60750.1 band 7 protein [Pedosphaera parvula Ellin514]
MKKNPLAITIGALLIVIFVLLLFVFQVRKSEVAVVTTFGRISSTKAEPGAYFKLPWPIQSVYKFDKRIQNFEDKFDEALTHDSYNLLSQVYVGWRISEPAEFYKKSSRDSADSILRAEKTLEGLVRNAKFAAIGNHPLSDFVSTNPKELKFSEIEGEILTNVQQQLSSKNYGIEMEYLGVKKLGFPESVTAEVFKRMQSERQVLISKTQNEGEAEASKIRTLADSKGAEVVANAEAQATRIRGEGQAQAAESFAVFQKNPELATFLLNLNALELSLKDRATLIFDQHTQPFNLFQGYSTNLTTNKK